jgi:phosphate transport system substrate-binding protein
VKLKRHGILAGIALTAATLALAGCGSDNTTTPSSSSSSGGSTAAKIDCATGSLTAQGSTAQTNAITEWIKQYQTACTGATINYQGTGSGAGVTAFNNKSADFAGSDSALKVPTEADTAKTRCGGNQAIDLPMVVGPIAVAYNLDGVTGLQLKPATLAKIFTGKIVKWDDPLIKADNPSATLPSTAIATIHRQEDSGTTDNFTNYLTQTAKADWTYDHAKAWKAPGGQALKGSDGVAGAIKSTPGAIGYVELSFAQNSSLSTAKIYNGAGAYQELTGESAGKTIEGATVVGTDKDLSLKIDYNTTTAGAYPIVLATYEIVCSSGNDAAKLPLIKSFLTYVSGTNGQAKLADLGYAPLPETVRAKVAAAVAALA